MTINHNNELPTKSVLLGAFFLGFNYFDFQAHWGIFVFLLMSCSADSEALGTFSVCVFYFSKKSNLIKALGQTASDIQSITADEVTQVSLQAPHGSLCDTFQPKLRMLEPAAV